jgi:hypothetical protein
VAFAAVAFLMTPIYRTATVFVSAGVGQDMGGIGELLGGALWSLGDLAPLAGINFAVPAARRNLWQCSSPATLQAR